MSQAPGKFHIRTFGCQMNVADTERMAALLGEQGMDSTDDAAAADVILINGCTVREKAVHKAVSALGRFQDFRRADGSKPIIGIGGCVGQLDKGELFKSAPYLDFVFGTDTIDNLPEIVHRVRAGERHVVYADFDKSMNYSTETKLHGEKRLAFVNIMKGCDKFCTYCIVPFTRGREKSRTIDEVVDDVARLVVKGVVEVTLLGQNVNSFGKGNANVAGREPRELNNKLIGKVGPSLGDENFPQLLRALDRDSRCAGLKRIRFTSSHPLDFSDELIECYATAAHGGVGKLTASLHLPVQSGSNRLLQKMGRHHQLEGYIAQMERLRELSPRVGLSTDLIVGFPSETEEDFAATLALLDRLRFDNVYAFAYSPRPGTRAAKLPDDVPDDVKNERLNRLIAHQRKIAETRYAECIGREMEILVEGEAQNQKLAAVAGNRPGVRVWMGRTSCNRIVNFTTEAGPGARGYAGRFVDVRIRAATSTALTGELAPTVHDETFAERHAPAGDAPRAAEPWPLTH